jgi:hypothetical protein
MSAVPLMSEDIYQMYREQFGTESVCNNSEVSAIWAACSEFGQEYGRVHRERIGRVMIMMRDRVGVSSKAPVLRPLF